MLDTLYYDIFQGNSTDRLVLDPEVQARADITTCAECVPSISSTIATCALSGDACAVVACAQDKIGLGNCYDCICFAVGQILGSTCETCSGSLLYPSLTAICFGLYFLLFPQ